MTLNALMQQVSKVFPKVGEISKHWDFKKQCRITHPTSPNVFVFYIVKEIENSFDPDATDIVQLAKVACLIEKVQSDLNEMFDALRLGLVRNHKETVSRSNIIIFPKRPKK